MQIPGEVWIWPAGPEVRDVTFVGGPGRLAARLGPVSLLSIRPGWARVAFWPAQPDRTEVPVGLVLRYQHGLGRWLPGLMAVTFGGQVHGWNGLARKHLYRGSAPGTCRCRGACLPADPCNRPALWWRGPPEREEGKNSHEIVCRTT